MATLDELRLQQLLSPFNNQMGIVNTTNSRPFMLENLYNAANDDLVQQTINQRISALGNIAPMSVNFSTTPSFNEPIEETGIKSLGFDTSTGVANVPDVIGTFRAGEKEFDVYKSQDGRPYYMNQGEAYIAPGDYSKKQSGFRDLIGTGISALATKLNPVLSLISSPLKGLASLNRRLRATDFGQSKTLAEYFQRREARKDAERLKTVGQQLQQASERGGGYQPTSREQNVARTESRVSGGRSRAYGL